MKNMKKYTAAAALALGAVVAGIALASPANAASTTANTSGSGTMNNPYNAGDYSWSSSVVHNQSWNNITNSTLTVHGGYNWTQVFSLTEKQAKSGDNFTVSGSVTITTPYGTGTIAVPTFTIGTTPEVPWATSTTDLPDPVVRGVVSDKLFDAEYDLVYKHNPGGVNADYWIL